MGKETFPNSDKDQFLNDISGLEEVKKSDFVLDDDGTFTYIGEEEKTFILKVKFIVGDILEININGDVYLKMGDKYNAGVKNECS